MFKNNKLLNWVLLIFATIQLFSQLFNYMVQNRFIEKNPFVNVLVSLGTPISDNWYSYSLLFIFTVLVCILYNKIINTDYQTHNNFSVIFMLLANLVLCNKLYSYVSLSEKANYIMNNKYQFTFILVIILILVTIICMLNKSHKLNEELKNMPPPDVKNDEDQAENASADQQMNCDSEYAWKHPFAYVWNTYKYYFAQRKQVKNLYRRQKAKIKVDQKIHKKSLKNKKNENELKILEEKLKTDLEVNNILQKKRVTSANSGTYISSNFDKKSSKEGIIATVIALIFIVALAVLIVVFGKEKLIKTAKEIFKSLDIFSDTFNNNQDSAINFIFAFGSILLFVVISFLVFFIIYFFIRAIMYFILYSKEDDSAVKRFVRLNKVFVFGIADSAMRILLFLPDFLECVQTLLLKTNLDDKLDEEYGLKNDFESYLNQNGNVKENNSEQE